MRVRFPRLIGTTGRSDFPPPVPATLLPRGPVPPASCLCFCMSGRPHAALGVLLTQTPELGARAEVMGSPRFLANPCGMPRSQSPASPSSQASTGFGFRLPLQVGRRRLHCVFRSSLARPTRSLSTLRGLGLPSAARKTRFRLVATLTGRVSHPRGPSKRFPSLPQLQVISSPSSRLTLAHTWQRPEALASART